MKIIPVGARGQFEMIVSDDDYHFLRQWRWSFARSHPGASRELIYARRCVTVTDCVYAGGIRLTKKFDLFVHHVVLARMGYPEPPEPGWTADHIDARHTLDNRRENLRWASPTFQVLNRAGSRTRSPAHAEHVREALVAMAPTHTVPAPAPIGGSMPRRVYSPAGVQA